MHAQGSLYKLLSSCLSDSRGRCALIKYYTCPEKVVHPVVRMDITLTIACEQKLLNLYDCDRRNSVQTVKKSNCMRQFTVVGDVTRRWRQNAGPRKGSPSFGWLETLVLDRRKQTEKRSLRVRNSSRPVNHVHGLTDV